MEAQLESLQRTLRARERELADLVQRYEESEAECDALKASMRYHAEMETHDSVAEPQLLTPPPKKS